MEDADFSGWATKTGLKCSDGRTIMPDAFKHQDGVKVPLVWQHVHNEPTNVLGHAILENRGSEGVYTHAFFNDTPSGQNAKMLVQHGDVEALSIYANKLVEKGSAVMHGMIREVSLVLSGANPGALIEHVAISHGDGSYTDAEDEAVIFTGLALEHAATTEENPEGAEVEKTEETTDSEPDKADDAGAPDEADDQNDEFQTLEHADDETVAEVYETFSDKQKKVVHFMIGAALEQADSATHADTDDAVDGSTDTTTGNLAHQEGTNMSNVFEQNGLSAANDTSKRLTHDQLSTIMENGKKLNSFKEAALAHAAEYGIENIELLFPDAKAIESSPQFISRRMEWVSSVLNGVKHSPFSKVKTLLADITKDEARAKGYTKGGRKVEEVFGLLQRTTGPATIYKKQKLDRDDILDITDINVVAWLKAEMRLMIEEELARAILVGDGRSNLSPDKVKDPQGALDGVGIRSILHDDPLYAVPHTLAANVSPKDAVKGLVRARSKYRGSGKPTLFISDAYLTDIMLEEDKFGRALYETEQALMDKLRVKEIVAVDLFEEHANLFAIMVSLQDYTIGTNAGGELTSFEDFDIDFNQHKYLQETRLSGGLTKPFSAIVVSRAQGTKATATQPSFDGATNTITVPTATGVSYFDTSTDEELTGDVVITQMTEVEARPDAGYYLEPNTTNSWTYAP